ncbi:hypothetical protein P3342_001834 [Pyrenophora teres f. teres]|nr:hypothetical protein P3342_001834 [Pyrenophora teres f. teres]
MVVENNHCGSPEFSGGFVLAIESRTASPHTHSLCASGRIALTSPLLQFQGHRWNSTGYRGGQAKSARPPILEQGARRGAYDVEPGAGCSAVCWALPHNLTWEEIGIAT